MNTELSKTARAAVAALALTWTSLAAAQAADGSKPGDDAMTCEDIAVELQPYAQQMRGLVEPLNATNQELVRRNQARMAAEMPAIVGLTAASTAAHADPTGVASRAVGQAEMAEQKRVWTQAMAEDKPLADQQKAQTNALVAQAQAMQSNARLQRLMALAQEKNCSRPGNR